MDKGSPIYYKDIQVGEVMGVQLTNNNQSISVPVWIDEQYTSLVGSGSKFWRAGGLNMHAGLSGINLSAESVKALIKGGIAFGNPNGVQEPAKEGASFQLHEHMMPGWLGLARTNPTGSRVAIHFKNGSNLVNDQSEIRYLGVKVGTVREVILDEKRQGVTVLVDFDFTASNFAREGSLFWVVKPEISDGTVRGLQTIGSGEFIQVHPGNGKPAFEFVGLEEPPPHPLMEPGMNVVLVTEKLGSVQAGSPVLYRGINVGQVLSSELGPQSQVVNITARIQSRYVSLVRRNTRFWNAGGIDVGIGLHGVQMQAGSLRTIIFGGVAFATPDVM